MNLCDVQYMSLEKSDLKQSETIIIYESGKGGLRITNHEVKMLNFTFHVKGIKHFHVSRKMNISFSRFTRRKYGLKILQITFHEIPFTTLIYLNQININWKNFSMQKDYFLCMVFITTWLQKVVIISYQETL